VSDRNDRHPRRTLSVLLAFGQLVLMLVWLIQGDPIVPAGRVSWIANLSVLWPVVFGMAGAGLLFTAAARNRQQIGHALCAGSCTVFASAALLGALQNRPPGNLTTTVVFVLLAGTHFLVAAMYRGHR